MRVAVYGTLKRGGRLHGNMEAIKAKFIEEVDLKGFEMYHLGGYPAIIEKKDGVIKAEVFEIDEIGLSRLDRVEGYPHLYQRQLTEHGFVYFMQNKAYVAHAPVIEDGNWKVRE
jgi:gamma-glutamylcyclotransferase (GGCT)/AIG2-like uncharacterized protein YtfP